MKLRELRELIRETIQSLDEVNNRNSPYVTKARKLIELYTERPVGSAEVLFHKDPRNPAVAIRAAVEVLKYASEDDEDKGINGVPSGERRIVDFLLEPGLGGANLELLTNELEEVEFNSWPPKSFQPKPPLGDLN